jgi:hypothetical protein
MRDTHQLDTASGLCDGPCQSVNQELPLQNEYSAAENRILRARLPSRLLRRHNIAPAPKRSQTTTWTDFIRRHRDVLAGTDFFTVEVLTWRGLVTYYVLFFIELETRRVTLGGIPDIRTRVGCSRWLATRRLQIAAI